MPASKVWLPKSGKLVIFIFGLLWIALIWGALQLRIEEDVLKTLPRSTELELYKSYYSRNPLAGKILIAIKAGKEPADNIVAGEKFIERIPAHALEKIDSLIFEYDPNQGLDVYDFVLENLPYLVDQSRADSILGGLSEESAQARIDELIRKFQSPQSAFLRPFLLRDPLQLSSGVMQSLGEFQEAGSFRLRENHLFTHNGSHVILSIQPAFPSSESKNNGILVNSLDSLAQELAKENPGMDIQLFGGPVIAALNSKQIQADGKKTGIIVLILVVALLYWYYRNWRIPLYFLIPALFGISFSLCLIYLFKGEISTLAIGAGSIVIGIILDYCFHYYTHLQHSGRARETVREIYKPLLLGCATTVLAFLSLGLLGSEILLDFGLFSALSLVGTALCVLVLLPQLPLPMVKHERKHPIDRLLDKIPGKGLWPVAVIAVITVCLAFFADEVRFEDDLNRVNYYPERMKKAEALFSANSENRKSLFLVQYGKSFQECLDKNKKVQERLDSLKESGEVHSFISLNSLFPDSETSTERVAAWNKINATNNVSEHLQTAGRKKQIKETAFSSFYAQLDSLTRETPHYGPELLGNPLVTNLYQDHGDSVELLTIVNVEAEKRDLVKAILKDETSLLIDNASIANGLVEVVKRNFNQLLLTTSLLVFFTLLITYGRLELAILTFLPMVISWVWILGICGLFSIPFNFINVLITTFVFGLGDDFCIFVSDGLLSRYKTGKNKLSAYRSSIALSALTTLIGTGVLIFSEHPALKSIALLSVVGMLCIAFISFTLQPILFDWLIQRRTDKGLPPLTLYTLGLTAIAFSYFLLGCIILNVLIPLFTIFPAREKNKKRVFHFLISRFTGSLLYLMINVRKRFINRPKDLLARPVVLVANHQSFIDILAMLSLGSKTFMITNSWVWNSFFFGRVVRYAGFIYSEDPLENSLEKIRKKVGEGYSLIVFPEGTRSVDGKIKRFHKGAFYLAKELQLPIIPVVLHGFNHAMRKNDFVLYNGIVSLSFLPPIGPGDPGFEKSHSELCKDIVGQMRTEFSRIDEGHGDTSYFRQLIVSNYLYKGPVIEWYVRIKLMLENNFHSFQKHVPVKGKIYDLGCGYGYLSFCLAYSSPGREVIGLDYDPEKVELAANSFLVNPNISFETADLELVSLQKAHCFILKDVLHYLSADKQESVLRHCAENLEAGGLIIVRDGFRDQARHQVTRNTELWSTRILKFNKTKHALHFPESATLAAVCKQHNLLLKLLEGNNRSSNHTYALYKP